MMRTSTMLYRNLISLFWLGTLLCATTSFAAPRDLVVVRPGGPKASEEAQRQVSRLIDEIGARAGWQASTVRAFYFNRADEALVHINSDRPGFLLSTPAFYLSNREELGMRPVNQILIDSKDTSCYCIVAQKGGVKNIEALKGGLLVGSALAEPDFVERIVLDRKLVFGTDVDVKYKRALSAIRALSRGEVQAVIVDEIEHAGLKTMPFADDIETIFCSELIPNTGVFALEGSASDADALALDEATREFCTDGEGASICETYQITGFQKVGEQTFDQLIQAYEGPEATP